MFVRNEDVAEIWACIARLKAVGMAILVIDKNLEAILRLADACVILEKGVSVWAGAAAALVAAPEVRERFLHI